MTIPQDPFRSQWQPIEVDVVGYRIVDTIEGAALEAIYLFCNQHPKEVARQPIGLFSTTHPNDPEWNLWQNRLNYSGSSALVIAIQPIIT
jgi:hypothetical protein